MKKKTGFALGVDLGGTNLRIGVVDSNGKLHSHFSLPTSSHRGKKAVLKSLSDGIQRMLDQCQKKGWPIQGIGFGCPGPIAIKKGIVTHAPNLPGWRNVPIKKYFEKSFRLPVVLENDANAFALAESWIGAGKTVQNALFLTLGTGVGGGVIFNKKIWHGTDDIAGEIGHMVIDENGPKCNCGNWGCLELYASATSVIRRAQIAFKKAGKKPLLTCKEIYQAAAQKNRIALKVTDDTARFLSAGITSLIHLLNPEMIIIGGGVALNGPLLFEPLRKYVKKRCFKDATLKIVPAKLGDQAGMVGAARAFFLASEKNHVTL